MRKDTTCDTRVISCFPATGKSYAFKNCQNKYTILDSDSSQFSWIKDENGNNTKERNPDFPNNYIEHIKENIGKVDIIFVSSHETVRKALTDAGIMFFTVYPKSDLLMEWVGRMYLKGNDKAFIDFIVNNWDNFMNEIIFGPHGYGLYRLDSNEYISDNIDFFRQW